MTPANNRTRVLLHVVTSPAPSIRSAAKAAGCSFETAHRHLRALQDEGLVAWEPRKNGTLRALVRAVPFGDDAA